MYYHAIVKQCSLVYLNFQYIIVVQYYCNTWKIRFYRVIHNSCVVCFQNALEIQMQMHDVTTIIVDILKLALWSAIYIH